MSGPNYEQQPQADYSTQSYAEYQESLKQNVVFASDRKPEKKQKKSGWPGKRICKIRKRPLQKFLLSKPCR